MCGIGGWLGRVNDGGAVARKFVATLSRRGPDSFGIESWPEASLVHTRLSVIDLSPAGAQPMANEDETIWTVLNGEIYNHRDLRIPLEACGHRFRGRSDTEVLPHLYEEHGVSFVEKLRGMFALAVYDKPRRRLILARDRFGIKPLFYARQAEQIAFASEINALLHIPAIDRQPNKQAIFDFAALFYIPAPETFFKGICALEPGETLVAELDGDQLRCSQRRFYSWGIAPDNNLTFNAAVERADELITTAVRRQMESDVALGALLSGGIDSSLVCTAAQAAVGHAVKTFNVHFPDEAYDETWAAVAVAQHIGASHQTLKLNAAEGGWNEIVDLLRYAGQPYADTSIFAANAVCRLIRQHVTVALSGDGGDEGFGGYSHYQEIARITHLRRFPVPCWYAAAMLFSPLAKRGWIRPHIPSRLKSLANADDEDILESLFTYLSRDEHAAIVDDCDSLPVRRLFERKWDHVLPSGATRLERLSAHATEVNVRLTLANDFLFKVDTASMKESLEVRVPMLDEDLFDFALTLPHALKVKDRIGKPVLRHVAQRRLPLVVAQKPKMGFAIPLDTWLDGPFRERLREELLGRSSRLPEFFRPEVYRPLVESFCSQRPYERLSRRETYGRITMLLSVHLALANPS